MSAARPGDDVNIAVRESRLADLPFLRRKLYEAVFWRPAGAKPSLEEGLALPEVRKSLADWDDDRTILAWRSSRARSYD